MLKSNLMKLEVELGRTRAAVELTRAKSCEIVAECRKSARARAILSRLIDFDLRRGHKSGPDLPIQ